MQHKQGIGDSDKQVIADDTRATHEAVGHRSWVEVLKHRWPTAIGIAVGILAAFDLEFTAASISLLAALPVLMALVYLGAAALDRRFAWPILLVGIVALVVLRSFSAGFTLTLIFLVAGLGFLALGVVRRQGRTRDGLPLQTVGVLIFGSLALAALAVVTDVSQATQVEALARATMERFGQVDLLSTTQGSGPAARSGRAALRW